jgi:general secretion pathway protein A
LRLKIEASAEIKPLAIGEVSRWRNNHFDNRRSAEPHFSRARRDPIVNQPRDLNRKLLQIVLSGQPELEEKLKRPQVRQLRQRIMLRCQTIPCTKEQTSDYVRERLRIAGANGEPVFNAKAVDTIHLYSLGIPRVINLLCEHSLVNAFAEHQRPIQPEIVEAVAREFQMLLQKCLGALFAIAGMASGAPPTVAMTSAAHQTSSNPFCRSAQNRSSR